MGKPLRVKDRKGWRAWLEQNHATEKEVWLAKVSEAKENGEWDRATLREDTTTIPPDLYTALQANRTTRGDFEELAPSLRKQYLWWITSAKTDQTRQKRIAETVRFLEANKKTGAK